MLAKKIILTLIVIFVSFCCIVPVSASVTDINVVMANNLVLYDTDDYIADFIFKTQELHSLNSGFMEVEEIFADEFSYRNKMILSASSIFIDFPTSEFVQGQSYNISFDISSGIYGNQVYLGVPANNYQLLYLTGMSAMEYKPPQSMNESVINWQTFLDFFPSLIDKSKLYGDYLITDTFQNKHISFDFSLPADYKCISDGDSFYNNRIMIAFLWRAVTPEYMTISNFKITPLGATSYLFDDIRFKEEVEQGLINIDNSISEGFSNLDDKLDDIINQPEQEKQEAENSADDSLNSIIDGIENKGPGFFSAIGSLVSALSYNGTDAKWQVPPLKLPAIKGAWDEIVLTDNTEIDFNYWIDKIPIELMKLIQALSTISLILYCFKELYGLFSYVFTLKGGAA